MGAVEIPAPDSPVGGNRGIVHRMIVLPSSTDLLPSQRSDGAELDGVRRLIDLGSGHGAGGSLRISQYVYFALSSATVAAAEMTADLGIEPDEITVRGSRRTTPSAVPVAHAWKVFSPHRGLCIDDQTEAVVARLTPIRERLVELVRTRDISATLVFVRYLDDDEGQPEDLDDVITDDGQVLHRIGGQHQLLGWCLTSEHVAFLASLNASITADEYG